MFVLAVTLLFSQAAFAQTKISGTVTDSNGNPVIGAVVMLQGQNSVGSTTDIEGKYIITLPAGTKNPKLNLSCLGYAEQTVDVNGRSVIDFTMQNDDLMIEETVVVGYGSVRKSDLTGSVTAVEIKENEASRATSLATLLQGHAAGVQVTNNGGSPDGGVSIRIRGASSLNGSNEPLYVVDGVILNTSSSATTTMFSSSNGGLANSSGNEETNGLMGLNPQDIESMEILKDASATAIYGALGANGVVLITTKQATGDRPKVEFSTGVDVSTRYAKRDILSSEEYLEFQSRYHPSCLSTIYQDPTTLSGLIAEPFDWQDYVMRPAVSQRYYLRVSGKPSSAKYNFSLGYNNTNGIIANTGNRQYTMRLNADKTVGKKLTFGIKTNLAFIDSDMASHSGRLSERASNIRSMCVSQPFRTAYDASADLDDDNATFNLVDLYSDQSHFLNTRKEFRVTPNLYAEYKIFPFLSFKSTVGADLRNSERKTFKSDYINIDPTGNIAARQNVIFFNWNWDNTLNYMQQLGNHHITATIGTTAYKHSTYTQTLNGWNIPTYELGVEGINAAVNHTTSYSESFTQTLSYFARAVYSFKDRYVLTATFRADGSSKFQDDNKWGYFPSGAFAWRINQEPWFKVDWISNAKLRIGWGRVGNQAVSAYQTMTNYSDVKVPAHYPDTTSSTSIIGLKPDNLANTGLMWETTEQTNIGIDLGMWDGRFSFTADVYDKETYGLLQKRDIPLSSGFTSIWVNQGTIRNRGLELSFEAVPIATHDFEWSVNGNISFNRNTLVSINQDAQTESKWITTDRSEDVVYYYGDAIESSSYAKGELNIFMEGYPMGLFYGYKVKGIVQDGETGIPIGEGSARRGPGYLDYYDLNGNGYLDEGDRTIIGDPNPDFTYGFGTTLTWKRFSLNALFNGVYGNDIYNAELCYDALTNVTDGRNLRKFVIEDSWSSENPDAKWPGIGCWQTVPDYQNITSQFVEDGSYLRLANLSLSYSIPFKDKKSFVKNIGLTASVKNLKIWTSYHGWDPDVNSFGTSTTKMGIDMGSYPSSRTFSFDVKFTF